MESEITSVRNLAKSFRPTAVAVLILLAGVLASLSVGMSEITFGTVLKSIFTHGETREELIVRTLRMPRTITAVLVGAGLAVAGALMQALTKNPLASPQIFGINAGASLFVVGSAVFFPGLGPAGRRVFRFCRGCRGRAGRLYSRCFHGEYDSRPARPGPGCRCICCLRP